MLQITQPYIHAFSCIGQTKYEFKKQFHPNLKHVCQNIKTTIILNSSRYPSIQRLECEGKSRACKSTKRHELACKLGYQESKTVTLEHNDKTSTNIDYTSFISFSYRDFLWIIDRLNVPNIPRESPGREMSSSDPPSATQYFWSTLNFWMISS